MSPNQPDRVPKFGLRSARPEDYGFAESLYLETGEPLFVELGIWNEEEVISRFKEKFNPEEVQIISVDGANAGWMQTSEGKNEIHLIQIHLSADFRSAGIGSRIIQDLMREARDKNKAVSLFVIRNNPALELYKRLGFEIVSENAEKISMRWELKQGSPKG